MAQGSSKAKAKGKTADRGYGGDHQARRKALLPLALGTMCPIAGPRCDGLMTNPNRMDLDHSVPRALGGTVGDRIACSPCNRGLGAALGNKLRGMKRKTRRW
jgi:hypothetical protein